jgi:hypothetical protein
VAIDFQFDSTMDGEAIKLASMIDERTRRWPLTAERLVSNSRMPPPPLVAAQGGADGHGPECFLKR